ncbi:LysR family transcriptional regulator [Erwinia sp. AnSW2-5]|uniref:LysR family transcriptional regulator n=1 Tax=Erwinia sp. AnSW2-5 TaxID=3367692 RepID=UPI00385807AB
MAIDVDLRSLKMFIAIAEAGVISQAADRLARTQAAVSMQLQKMEKDLDVKLVTRTSRGVVLTEPGEVVLAYARKMIALSDDMQRHLAGKKLVGRVRLGMVEDLAVTRLPAAIAEFRRHHPSVDIELTSSYSEGLARSLKEGRSDIVVGDPARFTQAAKSYISRELVWCASRMMVFDDAAPLPFILFDGTCSWQDKMIASLAEAGIPWEVGCRVSTFSAMISALRAGLGIGLLLQEGVPADCENIEGRCGLPTAPCAEFGVYLCDNPPPIVEALAMFLRSGY